jgi:formate C-acetyltransferase
MLAYREQINYFADVKIRGNNVIEKTFAIHLPVPFLSLLLEDCIANGKDSMPAVQDTTQPISREWGSAA